MGPFRLSFALAGITIFLLSSISWAVPAPTDLSQVRTSVSKMSVPFVPNAGQWDSKAAFAARTFAGTVFVTTEGQLVYSFAGQSEVDALRPSLLVSPHDRFDRRAQSRSPGWVLTETIVDTGPHPLRTRPVGTFPDGGKVSFVIGNDEKKYHDGIMSYSRVDLGEMYPGINVQLRATGSNVEKIFTVAPGRNAGRIHVRLDGAQALAFGRQGELIVQTGNGPVTYTPPTAYQEDGSGHRITVPVKYALNKVMQSYGFTVGRYDHSRALVIDPLLQSTYLGGSDGVDFVSAMAIHPVTGDVYVAGATSSSNFPSVAGAQQTNFAGSYDVFVTRLDATLTKRLQSTYLGGSGSDNAMGLAIHPTTGDVYVAGTTSSLDFPGVAGAEQTAHAGGTTLFNADGFVTRLDATLTKRLQSTYLGGSLDDNIWGLAIHPMTGEVYVAGWTSSTNFPKVAGAEQTTNGNSLYGNAFVTRLNAALTTRLQSTYVGGSNGDRAYALAIHPGTGDVYIAGVAFSSDFPKLTGSEQTVIAGEWDAFVTRLNAQLTARLQSTFLGGSGDDTAWALAIHPLTGEVYVAGYTGSTDFPKVLGSEQSIHGGGVAEFPFRHPQDGFVTRLNATLTRRLQSTYLGGSGNDFPLAMTIHPITGDVYVAGYTESADFPKVTGAEQTTKEPHQDAFITRLNAALTSRLLSTYLGGNGDDEAATITIHPATGEVYVAGYTTSTEFPKTAGAQQSLQQFAVKHGFVSRMVVEALTIPTLIYEFYNTILKHYFRTAEVAEATAIDNGAAGPGWQRTGKDFSAYVAGTGTGNDVCRFYTTGANTHFYTADTDECLQVKAPNSGWRYEGRAFRAPVPIAGICPQGTIPVYRNYNNRFAFNDSNHRFSTDVTVYNGMIAQGWIGEGVVMCALV